MSELPFLTDDVVGVRAGVRECDEDFAVEEVPLYDPAGEGTHVYFQIEKQGLSTNEAVHRIARVMGRPNRDVGYAGLKDAHALTRQMMSLEHVEPERIEALELPGIRVLSVTRHRNKLKIGHLWGNRFAIKLRGVGAQQLEAVRGILEVLTARGVPNYFGPQRFGIRGDTWQIGRAMLKEDWTEAVETLAGRPGPLDRDNVLRAREAYEAGDYDRAASLWPHVFREERRVCKTMARNGQHRRAFSSIDKHLKRLYVSAYQSWLFNQVVAARISALDRVEVGDLAWKHDSGAVFGVEDADAEQLRADAFEISPTGPLFGYRMTPATGRPGEFEEGVLSGDGLTTEDFRSPGVHRVKGARRPLRFRPLNASADAGVDPRGEYIELRFELPAGCYATAVLREICKDRPDTSVKTEVPVGETQPDADDANGGRCDRNGASSHP